MRKFWLLTVAIVGVFTISVKLIYDWKKEKTKRNDILEKAREAKANKATLKSMDEIEKLTENETKTD